MSAALGGATAYVAVFGTGLVASLSPCVYPMLPITLGFFGTQAQERRRSNILLYASGQVLAFVGLGAFTVFAGESLGFTSESREVCIGTGVVLLLAGVFALYGRMPAFLSRLGGGGAAGRSSAFALGAGSALVASPCTSPILAGVLALMASQATLGRGLALMLCYALGFASLFVLLGLGLLRLRGLPRAGRWMVYLHKLSAFALLGAGVFFIYRGV